MEELSRIDEQAEAERAAREGTIGTGEETTSGRSRRAA
jgi:hypothetical protein